MDFRFQLATDIDFNDIVLEHVTEDFDYTPEEEEALEYLTVYYWRVRAEDGEDIGEWSEVFSFTTQPPPFSEWSDTFSFTTAAVKIYVSKNSTFIADELRVYNGAKDLQEYSEFIRAQL